MEFPGLVSSPLAHLEMLITISSLILKVLWLFTVQKLLAFCCVFGLFENFCLCQSVVFVNLLRGPKGKSNYQFRLNIQSV